MPITLEITTDHIHALRVFHEWDACRDDWDKLTPALLEHEYVEHIPHPVLGQIMVVTEKGLRAIA